VLFVQRWVKEHQSTPEKVGGGIDQRVLPDGFPGAGHLGGMVDVVDDHDATGVYSHGQGFEVLLGWDEAVIGVQEREVDRFYIFQEARQGVIDVTPHQPDIRRISSLEVSLGDVGNGIHALERMDGSLIIPGQVQRIDPKRRSQLDYLVTVERFDDARIQL